MPGPYSVDLRGRALAACDGGERPSAVAERFQVARATVYPWLRQRRDAAPRRSAATKAAPRPSGSAAGPGR